MMISSWYMREGGVGWGGGRDAQPRVVFKTQVERRQPPTSAPHLFSPSFPQGHDWGKIWESIQRLIIKSLISVQPILRNNYRSVLPPDNDGFSCFEILGWVAFG